jgi:membrane associated rhomboid family serine protease
MMEETEAMRRGYSPSSYSYSFGPGPLTPAIKLIMIANAAVFVLTLVMPSLVRPLGLRPADLIGQLHLWQLVTYMFVHGGPGHILFNMLTLWMVGTEFERSWGTKYFTQYYFVCGIGAGLTQVLLGLVPFPFADSLYYATTVGASGAVYGLLLAYAVYFPHRPMLLFMIFPVPAKYFVMILGGLALLFSFQGGSGVAHTAHLGGIAAGYLYLKRGRFNPLAELRYRYTKWRIGRTRMKFDVYTGGKGRDSDRRIH